MHPNFSGCDGKCKSHDGKYHKQDYNGSSDGKCNWWILYEKILSNF